MKIESAAGEFEFQIESLKVTGTDVVVVGKMGVWEAETSMDRDDVLKLLRLTAGNPSFWRFFAETSALRRLRPKTWPEERNE